MDKKKFLNCRSSLFLSSKNPADLQVEDSGNVWSHLLLGSNRVGQTGAREPHAALRTFTRGSLSFSKSRYLFCIFYFCCKV